MYVFCRILVLLIGTGNENIYQTNRMNNKQKNISRHSNNVRGRWWWKGNNIYIRDKYET